MCVCFAPVSWQVEQTEMMFHLTRCLMEPNDTISLGLVDDLQQQLRNISNINNDLLVGNGVPGVLTLTALEVRPSCLRVFHVNPFMGQPLSYTIL